MEPALARLQKSSPGQQMMSVRVPMFGVARPAFSRICQSSIGLVLLDVCEQQILRVGHAYFAEAVAIGEIGEQFHLGVGGIAGRHIGLLQRHVHGAIARHLVRRGVVAVPGAKCRAFPRAGSVFGSAAVGGRVEEAAHARDFCIVDARTAVAQHFPFGFDAPA